MPRKVQCKIYAGLGASWVPFLHSITQKNQLFLIFEVSKNDTNTGPCNVLKSVCSCLKGPSQWPEYLIRNLLVYIDNDALNLARVQNVTTIHERLLSTFTLSYHVRPTAPIERVILTKHNMTAHTKGRSCFNVASITYWIVWRNIWRFGARSRCLVGAYRIASYS